jgi:cytochrome c553
VALTAAQTRDLFNPPDWYPDDHPAMPEIVGHGRRPEVRACGYCHLPNGQGRPENASLVGLPAGYIVQQMADYKNGLRKSSEPAMGPPAAMLGVGQAANDAEVKAAVGDMRKQSAQLAQATAEQTRATKDMTTGAGQISKQMALITRANREHAAAAEGCVGFFWPSLYVGSVTLFLLGSLLFLAAALGAALLEHGPST